ncbi:CesT family type III secretion system chaperone [Serratia quinivorans]|uniref:CesT family type III secretion system chaperone n=1 Tax=Serratia quinivorans TaxID=137545 RepID=UPI00217B7ACE|nr:CesT family type III secretion system chaperone [Serratia quinivorans]CAI1011910.1 Tir chaperone [Serratia quinivorans]CAI1812138.1 Tir chaperone [Serratia quinivorans]
MTNDELLHQFGQHVGIKNLRFDAQRSCQLNIDNQDIVIFNEINSENIMLNCIVGHIPPQQAETSALILLSTNMMFASVNGPYVTWEPQNQILLLSLPLQSTLLDITGIEEQISLMLKNVAHLRSSLTEKVPSITF